MKSNLEYTKSNSLWVESKLIEQRIDSQFYKSDFVKNEKEIKKISNMVLKEMYYKGDYGSLPDSNDYCDDGIFLIRGTDLRDLSIDREKLVIVPKEYFNEKSEAKEDDILMLIKGATIDAEWSVSIVPSINYKSIFNGSIFRIRLKSEYDPYYLTAFMSTKYFLKQKKRAISNTGIFYNDKNSIENFIIAVPSLEVQKYIGDKIRKAADLKEKAKVLKKESEDALDNAINIDNDFMDCDKDNGTWINANKISIDNITGDYYKKMYLQIENKMSMSGINMLPLEKITKGIVLGNTKKISEDYCGSGIPYITTKNIKREGLDLKSLLFIPEDKHNSCLKKSKAFSGDILYNKSGNVGLSAMISDEYKEYNVVSDIIIIKPDIEKINGQYLVTFLNSKLGKNMSERMSGGAIFQHISIYDIAKIQIPMLPIEIQDYIGKRKMLSEVYNKESNQLIDEARHDIENLIEGKLDMFKIKEIN